MFICLKFSGVDRRDLRDQCPPPTFSRMNEVRFSTFLFLYVCGGCILNFRTEDKVKFSCITVQALFQVF